MTKRSAAIESLVGLALRARSRMKAHQIMKPSHQPIAPQRVNATLVAELAAIAQSVGDSVALAICAKANTGDQASMREVIRRLKSENDFRASYAQCG